MLVLPSCGLVSVPERTGTSCRYGSCGQYERNVTTGPLVPDSTERSVVPGYVRTSKAERLLSLKPFQYMSDAVSS